MIFSRFQIEQKNEKIFFEKMNKFILFIILLIVCVVIFTGGILLIVFGGKLSEKDENSKSSRAMTTWGVIL